MEGWPVYVYNVYSLPSVDGSVPSLVVWVLSAFAAGASVVSAYVVATFSSGTAINEKCVYACTCAHVM